jgi:hypothetical protein
MNLRYGRCSLVTAIKKANKYNSLFVYAHLMTFSSPDSIMLNGRMISEYRVGEAVEGSGHGIIGYNFFGICLQGLRKTMEVFVPCRQANI